MPAALGLTPDEMRERKNRLTREWNARNREKVRETNAKSRAKYREKELARRTQSKLDDPQRWKDYKTKALLKRYGLTPESYIDLLTAQGGRCAICQRTDPGCSRHARLAVDHCHTTGKVRGLLCNGCNRGIGFLMDNPTILRAAADYLEKL